MIVHFENHSPKPQTRWMRLGIPTAMAEAMPDVQRSNLDKRCLLVKTRQKSAMSTLFYLRKDLRAGERGMLLLDNMTKVEASEVLPPINAKLIMDNPARSIPRVELDVDQLKVEAPMRWVQLDSFSPAHMTGKLEFFVSGHRVVLYATLYAGQDVIDLQGSYIWSDLNNPAVTLDDFFTSVRIKLGEELHLRWGDAMRFQSIQDEWTSSWQLTSTIGDAFMVPFFGIMLPQDDSVPPAATVDATPSPDYVREWRMDAYEAARLGDAYAYADRSVWNGHWFAHKAIPDCALSATVDRAPVPVAGNPLQDRVWSNSVDTGRTGSQKCFGRTKGLSIVCSQPAGKMEALRWASTDLMMRGHHHMDHVGRLLLPGEGRTTWNGYRFRFSQGWGRKPTQDPPYGAMDLRFFMDDQHRGNHYPWVAKALLHDELMGEEIDFLLMTDAMRFKRSAHQFDASRSSGRLMQDWADIALVGSSGQMSLAIDLFQAELEIVEAAKRQAGSMHACTLIDALDGKNPLRGSVAWVPWQESILCDGLWAWLKILRERDYLELAERIEILLDQLSRTVVEFGIFGSATTGFTVVGYGKWFGDTEPPADYYTLPRPGAVDFIPRLDQDAADLIYGGISPFWYSGAILFQAEKGHAKAVAMKAEMLAPRNLDEHEWVQGL